MATILSNIVPTENHVSETIEIPGRKRVKRTSTNKTKLCVSEYQVPVFPFIHVVQHGAI